MWDKIADLIIRYRAYLLAALFILTFGMAYLAQYVKISHRILLTVPDDDVEMQHYHSFKKTFGDDGMVMGVAFRDSSIFKSNTFGQLNKLVKKIEETEGVASVISPTNAKYFKVNHKKKRFDYVDIFPSSNTISQRELDSSFQTFRKIEIYRQNLIGTQDTTTMVVLIRFIPEYINSLRRVELMEHIQELIDSFASKTGVKMHKVGMPAVRHFVHYAFSKEFVVFLYLAVIITALSLACFFRSFYSVLLPIILVGIIIIWVLGTLSIFGFNITILSGLLPPIMVIIAIPNCIYMLNNYHRQYLVVKDKIIAIKYVVKKIGAITIITNGTTAAGFFVLAFTDIHVLKEFGIVATINIIVTFFISIIFIPSVYSYLPAPKENDVKHLEFQFIKSLLDRFYRLSTLHYKVVLGVAFLICIVALYGSFQLRALTYFVDDLSEDVPLMKDMRFYQKQFTGSIPLEVILNTNKEKGTRKMSVLKKADEISKYISSFEEISKPLSWLTFIKYANQAYNDYESPEFHTLPKSRDRAFLYRYIRGTSTDELSDAFGAYIDSTEQYMRLSFRMKDMGSIETSKIVSAKIRPYIEAQLEGTGMEAVVTGSSIVFLRSNSFLINNLKTSMFIAFGLVSIIMGILFKRVRMTLISLIPNIIPIIITAGMMGFAGVALKPSAVLVFSIAFGISVDDTIHFLARFRQEFLRTNNTIESVHITLQHTGASMLYTSIILFFGFIVFTGSTFQSTQTLGFLSSLTLIVAMFTNLLVLPSLIVWFEKLKIEKNR